MTKGERLRTVASGRAPGGAPQDFDELVRALGDRVKRLRARRGMSRKVLSEHSGVSERYLAQLESGKANVSFQVLLAIAGSMNIGLTDLLADGGDDSPDLVLAKRFLDGLAPDQHGQALRLLRDHFAPAHAGHTGAVALIGLRGAGKSTLGQLLATHYRVPFIRLGALVEKTAGIDMAEIFLTMGQKGYRRLEYGALQQAIARHPRVVIETGGSIVSEARTFDLLINSCFTVWLRATPEEHMRRVMQQGDLRPMEGSRRAMEDLQAILTARSPFYGRADAQLVTVGRSERDCLAELIGLTEPYLGEDRAGGDWAGEDHRGEASTAAAASE